MAYYKAALTYTWWRGDPLPPLRQVPKLHCARSDDVPLLATLHGVSQANIEKRLATANNAYIAFLAEQPAGYGWSADRTVGVGDIDWPLGPPDRGLWDFATLPAFRGRGIYPHLLQAILRAEEAEAARFWIGHRADNNASERGIVKAGFQFVNIAAVTPDFQLRLVPRGDRERSLADPQGLHFGFVDVADSDMVMLDFDRFPGPPPGKI